jgi:hypothetical protein
MQIHKRIIVGETYQRSWEQEILVLYIKQLLICMP